jgi:hypothetical protein
MYRFFKISFFIAFNFLLSTAGIADDKFFTYLLTFSNSENIIYFNIPTASQENSSVYIGIPGNLKKVPVESFQVYRDGGSIEICKLIRLTRLLEITLLG